MKSELEKVLINNNSSIFAKYIVEYNYLNVVKGAIYIPNDTILKEILSDLRITLAQFEKSSVFKDILKQHLIDTNIIFKPSVVKGKIIIDGLSIMKAVKVGNVNVNFIDGVLALDTQVAELTAIPGKMLFGLQIFLKIDAKYKLTRVFGTYADEVVKFYREKELTKDSFDRLMTFINGTEERYDGVVERVKTKMEFLPASGSNGVPVGIGNASDWADIIGELNFLVKEFRDNMQSMIRVARSTKNLETECSKKSPGNCDYPCRKKKSLFGKETCIYPK